ncbi:putative carboxypeptidase [Panaeolus papilionaceus]|nr:putative carboxypeptidase [Panaeolus papilionaceus]
MKFNRIFSLLAVLLPVIAVPARDHTSGYDGIKVLRIPTGKNTAKLDALIESLELDVWTHASRPDSHVDVEVPKNIYKTFTSSVSKILKEEGVTYPVEIMHEDLGVSIRKESEGLINADQFTIQAGLANQAWFNAYHSYNDHLTWLDDLVATFPNNARVVSTGTSVGGRNIKGINIFGSSGSGTKPAIIWHGNIHAREWITSMTVEYLAYSLLNNYANSTEVKGYVDKYDFYIFPITNPDGFVFSQTSTRLWRKNRSNPPSGSTCYGRDLNRNWNVAWSQTNGASTSPCSETYKGQAAADTPEVRGLSAFIDARASSSAGAKMFVDWHSYSQLFMYPYGYNCNKVATDDAELGRLSSGFATALRAVYGTRYTTGPICTTIYATTGSSTDYAYDVSKIKYSFAAELRDTGSSGFVLPANQIRPSGEETWAGVKYLLANMA